MSTLDQRPPGRRGRDVPAQLTGWSLRGVVGLVILGFALFFAVPIVWLLAALTKSGEELTRRGPFTPGSIHELVRNWQQLHHFQGGVVTHWFLNSVYYSLAALVLTLLISVPAGYALATLRFRARRALLVLTLIVMLMPSTSLVLPIFLEMNKAGLVGDPLSVILPWSFYPFGVYLTFIYFSTSLPGSLLSAARIDGCTEFQVFTRIALPLAKPVVALVAFFSFVQNWNNYFLPFVMLPTSDRYPIQVGLSSLLASTPAFNPSSAGADSLGFPALALATLVSVLPVLIIFLFSQRFLITGMTTGGIKE
jgi:multiple sugar transport system permease protein